MGQKAREISGIYNVHVAIGQKAREISYAMFMLYKIRPRGTKHDRIFILLVYKYPGT